ncbi:MAG: hypothetical protein V5A44_03730 [Haloarculaceae archaeon]
MSASTSRQIDYAFYAKAGFLLGLALFVVGTGGELVGTVLFGSLPVWEETLLVDLEILGILAGLCAPLGFGVVLPLTE